MIRGVGVDIVDIERIEAAVARFGPRFAQRILSEREQAEWPDGHIPVRTLAGRFAAKEAVSKALGTGISGFSWHDIEVLRAQNGCPSVRLHAGAERRAQEQGVVRVWVSLSHERTHAVATAVAEG